MACEYDTLLFCHSSRYLGLERRGVEQGTEGSEEDGAGARGDAAPDAAERREERGVHLRVPERRAACGGGRGRPVRGGPGGREDEGGAGVGVGRVVHLELEGGGGVRGAGGGGEGERGAVGDEQAVVVGQRRRRARRGVRRHRGGLVGQWRALGASELLRRVVVCFSL